MRLGLCNVLPGHSRCGASVEKGKCPGIEKQKCCSDQRHNATPAELTAAQSKINMTGGVMRCMLADPGAIAV